MKHYEIYNESIKHQWEKNILQGDQTVGGLRNLLQNVQ